MKFKDFSIKKKLIALSMLAAVASLFVVMMFILAGIYFGYHSYVTASAKSFARVVGGNCVTSLLFDDRKAARETLKSLRTELYIKYARVYSNEGEVFAEYQKAGENGDGPAGMCSDLISEDAILNGGPKSRYDFWGGGLCVVMPVKSENDTIGAVEIFYSLHDLYQTLISITGVSLLAVFCSVFIAYLLSSWAQRYISGPILTLGNAMDNVSRKNDYTIRVEKETRDELGFLFERFNEMLAEIQERDEKLFFIQHTVDHMKDTMYWIDPGGGIVNANATASTLLGYSKEEILSMSLGDIDPFYSMDNWPEQWQIFREYNSFTFEAQNMTKDGNIIPVEVNINYLNFKNKEFSCAIIRDLTDKKKLESQLEQAQKMRAIGTLAAGVAHDLNNILGAVVGYPQIMLLDIPEDSPLRSNLMAIQKSGQKAAAIIQDMLTLARRGVELQNAVNLNEIIEEYLKSPEHQNLKEANPGIHYEIHMDQSLPNILGSDFHICKVMMNLVTNATEAMSMGSGTVKISTSDRYIEKVLSGYQTIPVGQYAVISVEDKGSGISETDLKNIFEPFYTKKVMGKSGTGLGMTVVAGVVKDHNGFIDITSTESVGTIFDLYFPVTDQAIQKKENVGSFDTYKGNETILVVDDIQEQREVACAVLKKLGYKVEAVSSGEEALDFLKEKTADLLVLDMIMEPGMDGLDTYKRILELHPRQKAVIATGYAETERVKTAMQLGVGSYVKKPYTIKNLGLTVRKELDA